MKRALSVLLVIVAPPVIGCTRGHDWPAQRDWRGSTAQRSARVDTPGSESQPTRSEAGPNPEARGSANHPEPVRTRGDLPEYEVVDLGTLGGSASMAYDINDLGQVVGCAEIRAGVIHAFVWQDGVMTDLGVLPGDTQSCAEGVNNAGQVVGLSYEVDTRRRAVLWQRGDALELASSAAGARARGINDLGHVVGERQVSEQKPLYVDTRPQAFLWRDGEMVDVGRQFEDPRSVACAINNLGQVVGYSECDCRATPGPRAFLWDPGDTAYLGTLGGGDARALAINDSGAVVGEAEMMIATGDVTVSSPRAFIWQHGRMINLGTLGGATSCARGVNASGHAVGWSATSDGSIHAFFWNGSVMIDLNSAIPADSGWVLTKAHNINNLGDIAGEGAHHGQTRAFLVTPRP
jgi:probable HAF family extracellular repeat protein